MRGIRSTAVRTGMTGGVVFLIHALIPYSRSYPFIWPVLTGAATFWIATRDAALHRILGGMLATLVAAIIVGLIGFVGSTLIVFAESPPALRSITEALGIPGPILFTASAVLALATISLIATLATLVGGTVMIPVRLAREWRTNARVAR